MSDYRNAGTFWPANAGGEHPNAETILGLPGSGSLIFIVADSARYWWRQVKARADLAVWRGLPRPNRLPAHLGWGAQAVAAECVNLWDEAPHSGTEWFTPLNELQFSKESGEDWQGYADMAGKLSRLRPALRAEFAKRGQDVRLLFPAWVPGDDLEHADEWMDEAMQWDGIRLHAYDNSTAVRSRYWSYRTELIARYGDAGRTVPILVDETNANHTGADEREMLIANGDICRDDPACLGFAWYIYETRNPGEQDLSVWGNPERFALFSNPPAVPEPLPGPAPEPEPVPMTRDEIIALIVQKANDNGLAPWEFLGGAIAESGLDPEAWRQGVWPDWSAGLYQQTVAFADEGDHSASEENVALIKRLYFDPVHACDVAAVKFKYWRYNPEVPALTAWCAYNLPASYHHPETNPNLANYQRGLAEAQQILGVVVEQPGERTYGPDVPSEVISQRNTWSCAVRSTYAALWSMAQTGHGEPVSYGDEGPRDVYDWLVPAYDDPSVGLHDHTGAGLAQALKAHGYAASNLYPASLASVQARAGLQPVLLGGDVWNHWVMVRGLESDGTLILENPSPGFGGISNELRDSFGRLGPMAMVWIDVPTDQGGDVTEAEAAALRAENQHLRDMLGYASHDIAAAIQKEIDAIKPSLNALEAANNTLKQQTLPAA